MSIKKTKQILIDVRKETIGNQTVLVKVYAPIKSTKKQITAR